MKGTYKRALARALAGVLVFALMAPGIGMMPEAKAAYSNINGVLGVYVSSGIPVVDDFTAWTGGDGAAPENLDAATYSHESGTLPDGLAVGDNGEIRGTPLEGIDNSTVTIKATVGEKSSTKSITVNIDDELSDVTITMSRTNGDKVGSVWTPEASDWKIGTKVVPESAASAIGQASFAWSGGAANVTGNSYTLAEGDIGKTLKLTVTSAYTTGSVEKTFNVAAPVPFAAKDYKLTFAAGDTTKTLNVNDLVVSGSGTPPYKIFMIGQNDGKVATISNPTSSGESVTVTAVAKGTVKVQVSVEDNDGEIDISDVTIEVPATNDNQAQVDAIAEDWLTWSQIRGSNPSDATSGRYELRSNLNRPSAPTTAGGIKITDRSTISFNFSLTSINPSNSDLDISSSGVLTRADRYTTATLVVTVVKGSGTARVQAQETFPVFANDSGDMIILEDVAAWIAWSWIRGSNTDNSSPYDVYTDLDLDRAFRTANTVSKNNSNKYYTADELKDVRIRWFWDPDNSGSAYDVDIDLYTGEVDEFPERDSRGDLIAHVYFNGEESYYEPKSFDVIFKAGDDQAQVDAVQNWLTWNIIRGSNAAQSSKINNTGTNATSSNSPPSNNNRLEVTSNLNLNPTIPPSLDRSSTNSTDIEIDDVTIRWSASPSRISGTGIVTFPASGSTQVTLTATIEKGNATDKTKTFYLSILPAEDQAVVNEAITWLTWNQIRKSNGANSSSTGPYITFSDLTLPTSYETDDGEVVTIRWNTSNSNYVRTNGEVTPPSSSQSVTLTAVFTYESISSTSFTNNPNTKTFTLTVRRPTDSEAVAADRDAITWDFIKRQNTSQTRVTTDLNLPDFGDNGSTIVWSSSNTAVISNTGRVTRPAAGVSNATVTLTASLRKGNITNTKTITVTVLSVDGETAFEVVSTANGTTATLSREGFAAISKNGTNSVEAKMGICDISFDANAASTIYSQTNGNIVIAARIVPSSEIPAAIRTQLGDRPVIDLTILGGDRTITNFNGTATVRIPYTLRLGEKANSLVMYYLDSSGSYQLIRGFYDSVNKQLVFKTKHFSRFQIGYNPKTFTDIQDSWAIDAIEFIGARELTVGITGTSFEPLKALSRGEFTANLMKAYGIGIDRTATDNFSDVNPQEAYAPYLATGKKMGIITGTGGNNFAPTRQIGRAEMFALLYNILKAIGEVPPAVEGGKTLASFTDSNEVGEWFREGVDALLRANMIDGTGNNLLQPRAPTARATMAQMLYNLLTR